MTRLPPKTSYEEWMECLLFRYGSPGRFLLRSLFQKGLVTERPNFGVKHCALRYGERLLTLGEAL